MAYFKEPVIIDISSGSDLENSENEQLEETISKAVEQLEETSSEAVVELKPPETYVFKMEKYRRLRLNKHLGNELGLEQRMYFFIVDKYGKDWEMGVSRHITMYGDKRYSVLDWPQFMEANGISIGDMCTFHLIKQERKLKLINITKN